MNAIDTNILVYAIDSHEPVKQAKSIALIDDLLNSHEPALLLYQVAGEFLACVRRWSTKGRISPDRIQAELDDILSAFPLSLPRPGVFHTLLDISSRHSLSHWDSMLLAACIEAGVTHLYSEDLTAGATYDSVTVVNPFA